MLSIGGAIGGFARFFPMMQLHYKCKSRCYVVAGPIGVCSVSHRAEPAVRLMLLAALLFAPTAEAATLHGRVTHVVDGDTLDVVVKETRVRVRILDIDAPEYAQPYGHRSRQSLIALCGGEAAQIDGHKHDRERPSARTRAL
jgi:endonuclease YncB( thermonuclease family)